MAPNRSRSNSNVQQQNEHNRSYSPNVPRLMHKQRGSNHAIPSPTPGRSMKPAHNVQRTSTPQRTPAPPNEPGMSPASRYNHNLRVLRRRDPTIVSIFDQFPHVCVYNYNKADSKWEKKGYEGSFFLFERGIEPKYGFFILNRQGMDDYIQYIMPTDNLSSNGEFVWYHCPNPSEATPMREPDSEDEIDDTNVIGLWMLSMDTRESLADVLQRVLDCVKRKTAYPKELRYGPDRNPPLSFMTASSQDEDDCDDNWELESGERSMDRSFDEEGIRQQALALEAKAQASNPLSSSSRHHGMTELDQLFAKINPVPTQENPQTPPQANATQLPPSSSPSRVTANSILEMLNGGGSQPKNLQSPPTQQHALRGAALLDTMFASVSQTTTPSKAPQQPAVRANGTTGKPNGHANLSQFRFPQAAPPSQTHPIRPIPIPGAKSNTVSPPHDMEIHSPKPSSAALPQILTTEVIHSLMGLGRSASRASTAASEASQAQAAAQRSYAQTHSHAHPQPGSFAYPHPHPTQNTHTNTHTRSPSSAGTRRSQERGYFADRGEDDGGLSEASTGAEIEIAVDTDGDGDPDAGLGVGVPALQKRAQALAARPSFLSATSTGSTGTLKGDATPRARAERGLAPATGPASPPQSQPQSQSQTQTHKGGGGRPGLAQTVSETLGTGLGVEARPKQGLGLGAASGRKGSVSSYAAANRTVSAPSTVRVPFQASSELWPDSGLSAAVSGRSLAEDGSDAEVVELNFSEIGALNDIAKGAARGKDRGKEREKVQIWREPGAKQKEKEKEKERESERVQANGSTSASGSATVTKRTRTKRDREHQSKGASNTTSETVSVAPSTVASPRSTSLVTSPTPGAPNGGSTGLLTTPPAPPTRAKVQPPSNATGGVPADVAKDVLLGELARAGIIGVGGGSGRASAGPAMEKNAFVREVLTLIHTDKSFVDKLYQGYLNMA